MSLWIKFCGNTSLEDALLAAEAGADAVGFVFAASPRRVTREQVAAIVPQLPEPLEKIGVFVDASFEEIAEAAQMCGLTGVQLHFDAPLELTARLREKLGAAMKILRVMHFSGEVAGFPSVLDDANADGILVDSRTAGAVGGTGKSFDWIAASETIFREAKERDYHLIVAGGLNPENVAEAIRTLAPWGVDVVSGVEAAPGHKDAAKVRAFLSKARTFEAPPQSRS